MAVLPAAPTVRDTTRAGAVRLGRGGEGTLGEYPAEVGVEGEGQDGALGGGETEGVEDHQTLGPGKGFKVMPVELHLTETGAEGSEVKTHGVLTTTFVGAEGFEDEIEGFVSGFLL